MGLTNGQAKGHFMNGEASAGKEANDVDGDEEVSEARRWEGIPFSTMIIGALVQQGTDKTALRLFCGLFEMSMQAG